MKTPIKLLITEYTNQFVGSSIVDVNDDNAVKQDTVKDYLRIKTKEEILDIMMQYVVPVPDREISTYTKMHMASGDVLYKFTGSHSFLKFLKEVNGNYEIIEWKNEWEAHCVTCEFHKSVVVGYDSKSQRLVKLLCSEPKRNRLFIRFYPGNKGGAINDYITVLDEEGMTREGMEMMAQALSE